jgi:hypothetical protein
MHEQDNKLDNGELVAMHHGVSPNGVPKEALGLRHDKLEVVRIVLQQLGRAARSTAGNSTPCGTVDVEDKVVRAEAGEPAASSIAAERMNRVTTSI